MKLHVIDCIEKSPKLVSFLIFFFERRQPIVLGWVAAKDTCGAGNSSRYSNVKCLENECGPTPQTIVRRLDQVLRVRFGGKALIGMDLDYSQIVVNQNWGPFGSPHSWDENGREARDNEESR
jgi:hypothetical protein